MTLSERLMTVDEFDELLTQPENRDRRLELVDGRIKEKAVPTQEHGYVGANFSGFIWQYMWKTGLGRVCVDARYQTPQDKLNSRIPDISVSLSEEPMVTQGAAAVLPEIAVEIVYPDDALAETRGRIRYYMAHGTRIGIIVLPAKKLLEVYRHNREDILTEGDELSLEDVLPDFKVAISDLFKDTKNAHEEILPCVKQ